MPKVVEKGGGEGCIMPLGWGGGWPHDFRSYDPGGHFELKPSTTKNILKEKDYLFQFKN